MDGAVVVVTAQQTIIKADVCLILILWSFMLLIKLRIGRMSTLDFHMQFSALNLIIISLYCTFI